MIDRLPPATPFGPAQPTTPRVSTTAPFEDWLSARYEVPGLPNNGDEDLARRSADAASAALDAIVAMPEPVEAVFEFHLRADVGTIETVSVPWRLAGNDALSHLPPDPRTSTTAQLLQRNGSIGTTAARSAPSPTAAAVRLLWSPGYLDTPMPMVFSPGTPARTEFRAVAELAGSAVLASVAEPWLARLLRWVEQQGHDPVLWIRDYRLDDAASQAIVEEMRALANQQGWQLERIVVNGRELWRAPHTPYLQEKPSCL